MRTIVTLLGIDEAINNLGYTNEKQIKTRVIRALRQFYSDESSVRTVTKINPDDLSLYDRSFCEPGATSNILGFRCIDL